ncbi:MAG: capsular polysaccharide biosynthesis protein, partial [Bradyrhizobium sp.]
TLHALELAAFSQCDGVVGWGMKPWARGARRIAEALRRPYWTVEDGFFRSIGLGKAKAPSISLVVDDLGIHFDARRESRLERIMVEHAFIPHLRRAAGLRSLIVSKRLTKYNSAVDRPVSLRNRAGRRILLADQVRGDSSVAGACAGAAAFSHMLELAWGVKARERADIIIKPHPDVVAGFAHGYFDLQASHGDVQIITDDISTHAVLDEVDEVWVVSSQIGFEALLRDIPVTCFGVPFFAGWGLTTDRPSTPEAETALRRRAATRCSIDDLVAGALISYSRYIDPVTKEAIEPEVALECLTALRNARREC